MNEFGKRRKRICRSIDDADWLKNRTENRVKISLRMVSPPPEYHRAITNSPGGEKTVLTLFDYLRQRAFDAVIDGTQDALEFLDDQQSGGRSDTASSHRSGARPAMITNYSEQGHSAEPKTGDDNSSEVNQPPRRRGRPRKNPSAEK
ncbi:hypothetical protein [Novipirellula artificiosorum]|uniref:hypothetical protein n=1 Tax=Novipirellula artificiosorum TaxID=2528016 RepID=UPI0011B35DEC|nr:hypothetical protein [Novipirellula artificiosorum]